MSVLRDGGRPRARWVGMPALAALGSTEHQWITAMWLSRPVYESIPYYYMAIGIAASIGSFFLNRWFWAEIIASAGILSIVAGLVLWLKRRDYRHSRSRLDIGDQT